MEKGFYEVHRMAEYRVLKVVPHAGFDHSITIQQPNASQVVVGRYPKHWHRSLELFYVSGTGCMMWKNGEVFQLKNDDLAVINSGEAHEFYNINVGERGCSILISYSFLKDILPDLDNWYFVVPKDHPQYRHVTEIMLEILSISEQEDVYKFLMLRSRMHELIYLLVTFFKVNKASAIDMRTQKYADQYKKILEYIKNNYQQEISLSDTARHFGLTPEHFSRSFKNYIGVTFMRYVQSLRVEQAAHMLLTTDLSSMKIAQLTGEPNAQSLIRDFKREYHMTPDQFRRLNRARDNG